MLYATYVHYIIIFFRYLKHGGTTANNGHVVQGDNPRMYTDLLPASQRQNGCVYDDVEETQASNPRSQNNYTPLKSNRQNGARFYDGLTTFNGGNQQVQMNGLEQDDLYTECE